jgi:hypothetical protein
MAAHQSNVMFPLDTGLMSPRSPSVEPTMESDLPADSSHQNNHDDPEAMDITNGQENGDHGNGFPISVPYSAAFNDSLMDTMGYISSSYQQPSRGELPVNAEGILPEHLPIPLSSYLRAYTSPVPNISLTHPSGSLYGGPQPHSAAELHAYAQELISSHGIVRRSDLQKLIDTKIAEARTDLEDRLQERRAAKERNEVLQSEVRQLMVEREMEVRVAERWRSDKERAREMERSKS